MLLPPALRLPECVLLRSTCPRCAVSVVCLSVFFPPNPIGSALELGWEPSPSGLHPLDEGAYNLYRVLAIRRHSSEPLNQTIAAVYPQQLQTRLLFRIPPRPHCRPLHTRHPAQDIITVASRTNPSTSSPCSSPHPPNPSPPTPSPPTQAQPPAQPQSPSTAKQPPAPQPHSPPPSSQ